MAATQRQERVARAITEVLAEEIARLKDPRIGMVSVVFTEVTPDLRSARVHVSLLEEGRERAAVLKALRGAVGHLRGRLGDALRLRYTPDLTLVADGSIAEMVRLSGLLKDAEPRSGAGGEGGGDDRPGPGPS